MSRFAGVALILLAAPAVALDFALPPTARQTAERNTGPDIYHAPVGVFEDGEVPTMRIEGTVNRVAWRFDLPGLTPIQVLRPLRQQLIDAGYEIALDCDSAACGGFDFRFATETLPGPNMYVNIRAYHMVTGLKGEDEVVTLLSSTSPTSAYVQIIHGSAVGRVAPTVSAGVPVTAPVQTENDLGAALLARGHAVLADLEFDSGSTELGAGPFASLTALAEFLQANPEVRVALVGHTDTVGGLQPNIAISRDRARSVRQRLIAAHGIAAARMDAEGMGYLSPVASNRDAAGRDQNRRVEVILLNTQ